MLPSILVSYRQPAIESDFDQLSELLASGGTSVRLEERGDSGIYAGLEWLLPTAVVVFIGHSYIDGFVKEIGKDHYALLKKGLHSLYAKFVGPKSPELIVMSTAGKTRAAGDYSLLFSLLAEADDGLCFKLLIKKSATEAEYEATVSAFVTFLDAFHGRTLAADVLQELRTTRVVGRTLLLAYDSDKKRVVPIDPLADKAP